MGIFKIGEIEIWFFSFIRYEEKEIEFRVEVGKFYRSFIFGKFVILKYFLLMFDKIELFFVLEEGKEN